MINHDHDEVENDDELDWQLINSSDLTERADGLLCMAQRRAKDASTAKEALSFADVAVELNIQLGREAETFAAHWAQADAYWELKNFDNAYRACTDAIAIAESMQDDDRLGSMYFNAGGCMAERHVYEGAAEYAQMSADAHGRAGNLAQKARALRFVGRNYQKAGRHADAIGPLKESFELYEGYGIFERIADVANLIASSQIALGFYDEALENLERAETTLNYLDLNPLLTKVQFNQARAKAALGRHVEAIEDFNMLFDFHKVTDAIEIASHVEFERAKSQLALGQLDQAAASFKSISIAFKGVRGAADSLEALIKLAEIYGTQDNRADQEQTLAKALEIANQREKTDLANLLTLQIAVLAAAEPGTTRGLAMLEQLPRGTWLPSSPNWFTHTLGLMRCYAQANRSTEVLMLANELLTAANSNLHKREIAETHALKTQALAQLGETERAKQEASIGYEQYLELEEFDRAQQLRRQYMSQNEPFNLTDDTGPIYFSKEKSND
ncbi:MAG: hypothetical protein RL612_142 [Actinomycetota bacterium]|jgi:tetratricopeptide (TPR) repeat protein